MTERILKISEDQLKDLEGGTSQVIENCLIVYSGSEIKQIQNYETMLHIYEDDIKSLRVGDFVCSGNYCLVLDKTIDVENDYSYFKKKLIHFATDEKWNEVEKYLRIIKLLEESVITYRLNQNPEKAIFQHPMVYCITIKSEKRKLWLHGDMWASSSVSCTEFQTREEAEDKIKNGIPNVFNFYDGPFIEKTSPTEHPTKRELLLDRISDPLKDLMNRPLNPEISNRGLGELTDVQEEKLFCCNCKKETIMGFYPSDNNDLDEGTVWRCKECNNLEHFID